MMKVILTFLLASLVAGGTINRDNTWKDFKKTYSKLYRDAAEEAERRLVFEAELDYIDRHNALYELGHSTFTVGVNQFSDWTLEEYHEYLAKSGLTVGNRQHAEVEDMAGTVAPSAHDWRDHGIVSQIQNQGQCGSCWAFAVAGAVEGAWAKAHNDLYNLSEQELIDCGRGGCDGGWTSAAYDTIMNEGGIDTESWYPYEARDGSCRYKPEHSVATISGYRDVASMNEPNMVNVLYSHSPLTVLVDASPHSFKSYHSGVYYDPGCSQSSINHAILAVGYDKSSSSNSNQYWIVKNSWGTSWGIHGYIHMRMGVNQCNMARYVDYPTV